MPYQAIDIAKHILALSNPEVGDVITNLKLQKLLYYVQGFHLAITGNKLFEEDILAWQYGPVVPEVYHYYKNRGAAAIEVPTEIDTELDESELEILQEVYKVYGQYSALKLMEMTHMESPWQQTNISEVIQPDLMIEYFTPLIKE